MHRRSEYIVRGGDNRLERKVFIYQSIANCHIQTQHVIVRSKLNIITRVLIYEIIL